MKTKLSPNGIWSRALDPQKNPVQDNDVVLARLRSVLCSYRVLFLPGDPYALEKPPQICATWWKGRSPAIGNVLQEQRFDSLSSPELNFMQTWFCPIKITNSIAVKSKPQTLCRWISPETNGSLMEKGTDWNINEGSKSLSVLIKIYRRFKMRRPGRYWLPYFKCFQKSTFILKLYKQRKCNSLY